MHKKIVDFSFSNIFKFEYHQSIKSKKITEWSVDLYGKLVITANISLIQREQRGEFFEVHMDHPV